MSFQVDQTTMFNNTKDFFYKLIDSIDDEKLSFFLRILKEYDDGCMNILQAYQNCYIVIPKDHESKDLISSFNQLLPESFRRQDNNNKSSYESFKAVSEQVKKRIPDQFENYQSILMSRDKSEEERLIMLRQITKDHPDIFEKILNICSISDNDIERLRNNDSIESHEELKEAIDCGPIEVERLSSSQDAQSQHSIEQKSDVEEEPSIQSSRPEYSNQRLAEIAPKMSIIMSGLNQQSRIMDKSEAILFEKLYRLMKYKYEDIIKILQLYSEAVIGADETEILLKEYFGANRDSLDHFMNLLYSREVSRRNNSWFTKPISEFSLANCKIIDKSYTEFPSDFPMQICTAMDDICKQVLNEKWVSVPRGSEYFSFHIKNQNEEQLFVLEDERYELDNHIAMTGSTIEALNNLRDEYEQTQCSEEEFIKLRDKHLSIAKIKWIKHIKQILFYLNYKIKFNCQNEYLKPTVKNMYIKRCRQSNFLTLMDIKLKNAIKCHLRLRSQNCL